MLTTMHQSLLSFCFPSKNLNIKVYSTLILPVVLYGCETRCLKLKEEQGSMTSHNSVLSGIFKSNI
jgi:hypothetical protein